MADPNPIPPALSPKHVERFWSKVDRRGPDECWPWKAGKFRGGYGQFNARQADGKRRQVKAHRVSHFLETGDWPIQLICHTCDYPPCCNPAHLFVGTNKDNLRDCKEKGRLNTAAGNKHRTRTRPDTILRGEQIHQAKLTADQVSAIREMYLTGQHTHQSIADQLGVDRGTISQAIRGDHWNHVPVDRDAIAAASRRGRASSSRKRAKLHPNNVTEIRRIHGTGDRSYVDIAKTYGVTPALIAAIVKRRIWRDVP